MKLLVREKRSFLERGPRKGRGTQAEGDAGCGFEDQEAELPLPWEGASKTVRSVRGCGPVTCV